MPILVDNLSGVLVYRMLFLPVHRGGPGGADPGPAIHELGSVHGQ